MPERKLRLPCALLPDGFADDVVIGIDEAGFITSVMKGVAAGAASSIDGIAMPGLANVHSHAHQRTMAGLAEISGPGEDSFWTWREALPDGQRVAQQEREAAARQVARRDLVRGVGQRAVEDDQRGLALDGPADVPPAVMRCVGGARGAGACEPETQRVGGAQRDRRAHVGANHGCYIVR
jgi:formimidoylglutamate deiminase